MTKPTLYLGVDAGSPGVWKYSFASPDGGTIKGQVAVPANPDRAVEKAAAIAKIRTALQDLIERLEHED